MHINHNTTSTRPIIKLQISEPITTIVMGGDTLGAPTHLVYLVKIILPTGTELVTLDVLL